MNTVTISPEESHRERRLGLERRDPKPARNRHVNRRSGHDRRLSPDGRSGAGRNSGSGTAGWKVLFTRLKGNSGINEPNRRRIRTDEGRSEGGAHVDRSHERIRCEVPVLIEDYEIRRVTPATLYDYSKNGLYIETDAALRIGKGTIIHMRNYRAGASEPEDMRRYFARVVWVNKLSGAVVFSRYGVGVKLCPNIEEFIRLFGI